MYLFLVMLLCVMCGGRYSMLLGFSIYLLFGLKFLRIFSGMFGCSDRFFCVLIC